MVCILRIGFLIASVPGTGGLQGAAEGIANGGACVCGARGLLGVGSGIESADGENGDGVCGEYVLDKERASDLLALCSRCRA